MEDQERPLQGGEDDDEPDQTSTDDDVEDESRYPDDRGSSPEEPPDPVRPSDSQAAKDPRDRTSSWHSFAN